MTCFAPCHHRLIMSYGIQCKETLCLSFLLILLCCHFLLICALHCCLLISFTQKIAMNIDSCLFLLLLAIYVFTYFCRLPCVKQEAQQYKILYIGLYLLVWGEAANLRFMPECLCYIFHHVCWKICFCFFPLMIDSELVWYCIVEYTLFFFPFCQIQCGTAWLRGWDYHFWT